MTLSTWSALTLAVENSWGGPQSSEKRDWFAGAISDLLETTPDADVDYLEEFLLQVMNDEFEIVLEDESAQEIAAKIVGLRKLTLQRDFRMVDDMYTRWKDRQNRGSGAVTIQHVERGEDEDDTDWDSDDIEEEEPDKEDVDMGEAPALVHVPKEKPPPEIDEDGFTKVVGRKKR